MLRSCCVVALLFPYDAGCDATLRAIVGVLMTPCCGMPNLLAKVECGLAFVLAVCL